jgi:hypothetical protein
VDANQAMALVQSRFGPGNPELANGFAEHAPMGADALVGLGFGGSIVAAWADRHEPIPLDRQSTLATRRLQLLDELERSAWRAVLERHVMELAPHVGAHLFHGLIRTAHAVRALRRDTTDAAIAELATALAAWHEWAARPPASRPPPADQGGRTAREAIIDAARRGAGACARSPSIPAIHAVTAPMAALLLVDELDDGVNDAIAHALRGTHARHAEPAESTTTGRPSPADLAPLAQQWDAHPAKLVEAALRAHAVSGDGIFLDAAAAIMGPWPTMQRGSIPPSSPPGSG